MKKKKPELTKEQQITRLEKALEGKELREDGEDLFFKMLDKAAKGVGGQKRKPRKR